MEWFTIVVKTTQKCSPFNHIQEKMAGIIHMIFPRKFLKFPHCNSVFNTISIIETGSILHPIMRGIYYVIQHQSASMTFYYLPSQYNDFYLCSILQFIDKCSHCTVRNSSHCWIISLHCAALLWPLDSRYKQRWKW